MGKVNSDSTGKLWENTNIPNVRFLLGFLVKRKPMGKVNFHSKGNVWENTRITNIFIYFM